MTRKDNLTRRFAIALTAAILSPLITPGQWLSAQETGTIQRLSAPVRERPGTVDLPAGRQEENPVKTV